MASSSRSPSDGPDATGRLGLGGRLVKAELLRERSIERSAARPDDGDHDEHAQIRELVEADEIEQAMEFAPFCRRDGDDHAGLLKVLGLLRASDTLDSRSIDAPRLVLMRRDRNVQVWCFLREPDERAEKAFARRKKYRLLEQTLNCSVDVQVQTGDAHLLVA